MQSWIAVNQTRCYSLLSIDELFPLFRIAFQFFLRVHCIVKWMQLIGYASVSCSLVSKFVLNSHEILFHSLQIRNVLIAVCARLSHVIQGSFNVWRLNRWHKLRSITVYNLILRRFDWTWTETSTLSHCSWGRWRLHQQFLHKNSKQLGWSIDEQTTLNTQIN